MDNEWKWNLLRFVLIVYSMETCYSLTQSTNNLK